MRQHITRFITTIVILSLLPVFMGQDECRVTEPFKQVVIKKIKTIKNNKHSPKPAQIHISFYPIVSTTPGENLTVTNTNYLIAGILETITLLYNQYQVNFHFKKEKRTWKTKFDFTIQKNIKESRKITSIIFDKRLAQSGTRTKVLEGLLAKSATDIIITARSYEDLTGDLMSIEIAALFKGYKKIESRRITFPKKNLTPAIAFYKVQRLLLKDHVAQRFLNEKQGKSKKKQFEAIPDDVRDQLLSFFLPEDWTDTKKNKKDNIIVSYKAKIKLEESGKFEEVDISKMLKKLTDHPDLQPPPKSTAKPKTYICNLSFTDIRTRSAIADTKLSRLIDQTIEKGLKEASTINPVLAANSANHRIPNNPKNVNRLVNITFRPDKTKSQKIADITSQLMDPHHVNVIVSGQYLDDPNRDSVLVRPLIIVKQTQKIILSNLQFKRNQWLIKDPATGRDILSPIARKEIVQAVKQILQQI